jgi:hypothetical protein
LSVFPPGAAAVVVRIGLGGFPPDPPAPPGAAPGAGGCVVVDPEPAGLDGPPAGGCPLPVAGGGTTGMIVGCTGAGTFEVA